MKKLLTILLLAASTLLSAQDFSPLNFSGQLYVKSLEFLKTPRYISYHDHAFLTLQMSMPVTEVTPIELNFEKCTVTLEGTTDSFTITSCKRDDSTRPSTYIISVKMKDSNETAEFVYREHGDFYWQQIKKEGDEYQIARVHLSTKPHAVSDAEALRELLGNM